MIANKSAETSIVAIGHVPSRQIPTLHKGRPVTYALDPEGFAVELRTFAEPEAARVDAQVAAERFAGEIASDGWSIRSFTAN
ncbi:hypothetical protein [Phenylobacterium sp.]|uniref:hypothetical protein n=1 Tax=Phenylobacterium sp. TaxID=1871053 RepID=UPI002735E962|nr:hypothetical protein [Phenylobacterium sp.]MDP3659689.1 hypothetical protein [Phenylobacterium sp.]